MIIIILAVAVEQDNWGSRWFIIKDPNSIIGPTESDRRREERDEKAGNYGGERRSQVGNKQLWDADAHGWRGSGGERSSVHHG